jgi:hypothetical protein
VGGIDHQRGAEGLDRALGLAHGGKRDAHRMDAADVIGLDRQQPAIGVQRIDMAQGIAQAGAVDIVQVRRLRMAGQGLLAQGDRLGQLALPAQHVGQEARNGRIFGRREHGGAVQGGGVGGLAQPLVARRHRQQGAQGQLFVAGNGPAGADHRAIVAALVQPDQAVGGPAWGSVFPGTSRHGFPQLRQDGPQARRSWLAGLLAGPP